jgi:ribonuclease BN (tRNA processing enzyme)
MRRLLKVGMTIFDLDYIFLSHFHPDHSAELVPLIFATKYPDSHRRRQPLTIVAGQGLQQLYDGLHAVYGPWLELPAGMLRFVELSTTQSDQRTFDDFTVRSMPMVHNPESIAYRVSGDDGRSVVYSGDTDDNDKLVELAEGTDILICECAMPDEMKVRGHLTPSLAGSIADRARVRLLVLTHFYPDCDQVDIRSQCRRTYKGPLVLARDLLTVTPGNDDTQDAARKSHSAP